MIFKQKKSYFFLERKEDERMNMDEMYDTDADLLQMVVSDKAKGKSEREFFQDNWEKLALSGRNRESEQLFEEMIIKAYKDMVVDRRDLEEMDVPPLAIVLRLFRIKPSDGDDQLVLQNWKWELMYRLHEMAVRGEPYQKMDMDFSWYLIYKKYPQKAGYNPEFIDVLRNLCWRQHGNKVDEKVALAQLVAKKKLELTLKAKDDEMVEAIDAFFADPTLVLSRVSGAGRLARFERELLKNEEKSRPKKRSKN